MLFVQAIAQYFDAVGRVTAVRIDKAPDKSGTPRVWVEFETQAAAHDACELSGQVRTAASEAVPFALPALGKSLHQNNQLWHNSAPWPGSS